MLPKRLRDAANERLERIFENPPDDAAYVAWRKDWATYQVEDAKDRKAKTRLLQLKPEFARQLMRDRGFGDIDHTTSVADLTLTSDAQHPTQLSVNIAFALRDYDPKLGATELKERMKKRLNDGVGRAVDPYTIPTRGNARNFYLLENFRLCPCTALNASCSLSTRDLAVVLVWLFGEDISNRKLKDWNPGRGISWYEKEVLKTQKKYCPPEGMTEPRGENMVRFPHPLQRRPASDPPVDAS